MRFSGAPTFNEFVLHTDEPPAAWNHRLRTEKIVGGLDLTRWYPEMEHATLWCTTEVVPREKIDIAAKLVAAVPVEA